MQKQKEENKRKELLKKIEKDVEEIINNFMDKLKEVELEINEEDFYLIKNNELRKEGTIEKKEVEFIKEWKKTWGKFDEENYLIAEKAKWKR